MDSGERKLIAIMPLHAITSAYGEEGLRARFAADIEAWPEPDQRRLARALGLAARLHAADRRGREPYVNHLLRVAIRIISHYGVRDADVACAALLHDAVEDHAAELAGGGREAALAALAAEFGPRVADLVGAVTNPEYAPGRDPHEQYREHVAAGHQGLGLHRQWRRPDARHRPAAASAGRKVRAPRPGPAGAHHPARHSA